jgi:hypothetical protein
VLCNSGSAFLCVHSCPTVILHTKRRPVLNSSWILFDILLAIKIKSAVAGCAASPTEYTHRVAMATFWRRTFHHDGKISPAVRMGGGVYAHPLSLFLPSRTKLWSTLQLRGQIHSLYFYSTLICTLWLGPNTALRQTNWIFKFLTFLFEHLALHS